MLEDRCVKIWNGAGKVQLNCGASLDIALDRKYQLRTISLALVALSFCTHYNDKVGVWLVDVFAGIGVSGGDGNLRELSRDLSAWLLRCCGKICERLGLFSWRRSRLKAAKKGEVEARGLATARKARIALHVRNAASSQTTLGFSVDTCCQPCGGQFPRQVFLFASLFGLLFKI